MTEDEEAKYRLINKWCVKHNKPILCEDCLSEKLQRMSDITVNLIKKSDMEYR